MVYAPVSGECVSGPLIGIQVFVPDSLVGSKLPAEIKFHGITVSAVVIYCNPSPYDIRHRQRFLDEVISSI